LCVVLFHDAPTATISTLSLHDALPIFAIGDRAERARDPHLVARLGERLPDLDLRVDALLHQAKELEEHAIVETHRGVRLLDLTEPPRQLTARDHLLKRAVLRADEAALLPADRRAGAQHVD